MKPYKDNDKSAKVAGAVGTITVHLVLLLLLLFAITITLDPPEEEQGLTVNYGTSDLGSGLYEPAPQSAIEDQLVDEPAEAVPTASSAPTTPSAPDDLIAQETEESLAIKRAEEKKKKEEAEQRRIEQERIAAEKAKKAEEERIAREKAEAEAKKKAAEEAKKKQIASSTKNAFSGTGGVGTSNNSTGQGTGASSGNQGNPLGSAANGGLNGSGQGTGNGAGYSLAGRSISGKLPQPSYNKNESGTIVVAIEVDANGNVISAKAGAQGTTIGDASMRKEAENAAMKAKFNGISGNTVQSGTITYHYKLN
ncbi:MAG: energy transducer TonB [Paludibacteraceae bacterium]|nr:energy transducer TonB [Paludibacteraceae bacterium]